MPDLQIVIGNKNYSSWSLRAWLPLFEARLPFEEIVIPLDRPDTPGALRKWSPNMKVPVLLHGETRIWDSLAIAEYVNELAPGAGLWPSDRTARAMARAISAEMHASFAPLRAEMPMDIRRHAPKVPSPEVKQDIDRICTIWADCRARFGQGYGDFLFGNFTIADAFYAPVVSRFMTYGVTVPTVARTYMESVLAAPGMQAWSTAAREESWVIENP